MNILFNSLPSGKIPFSFNVSTVGYLNEGKKEGKDR